VTQYHVTLNSQGYVLDLDRYRKRVREPFAPKRATGSATVGDLVGPEQVLTLSDWSGGEGHEQHDEICLRRFIFPPDLHEDPVYMLDNYNWDTFLLWEYDPRR
jgi:hypothetical protein